VSDLPHDVCMQAFNPGAPLISEDRHLTDLDPATLLVLEDLHENVIQRVYATGVGLQALVGQLPDAELANRLRRHIVDLDDTLDEIRSTLDGLRLGLTPIR